MLCGASVPAVPASFSNSIHATTVNGGAVRDQEAVLLPNSGSPGFVFTIVLPEDYQDNGTVHVDLYLRTVTGPLSCTVVVEPNFLRRARAGSEIYLETWVTGLTGIKPANGDPSTGFPATMVARKAFNLKRSSGFPSQRKGDVIVLGFVRNAAHALDSCPEVVEVRAINIRYPVETP
jgi:hypothetical protein